MQGAGAGRASWPGLAGGARRLPPRPAAAARGEFHRSSLRVTAALAVPHGGVGPAVGREPRGAEGTRERRGRHHHRQELTRRRARRPGVPGAPAPPPAGGSPRVGGRAGVGQAVLRGARGGAGLALRQGAARVPALGGAAAAGEQLPLHVPEALAVVEPAGRGGGC